MKLSTDETVALIVRWYALIGVVRGGVEPSVAREVLKIPDSEFHRVTIGEDPVFKVLSGLYDNAVKYVSESRSPAPATIHAMIGAAMDQNPAAIRWLELYLIREGRDHPPSLDERIAYLQALQGTIIKVSDIVALDTKIGALVEEQKMLEDARRRTIDEMTTDALKALDKVMTTGEKGEKRKSATAILNHAINLARQEKVAEVVMQAILPSIRRFSEEMVRLAEIRMDQESREAWRLEAEEQLRQLLLSVATIE